MDAVVKAARAEAARPTWRRPSSGPGSRSASADPRTRLEPITSPPLPARSSAGSAGQPHAAVDGEVPFVPVPPSTGSSSAPDTGRRRLLLRRRQRSRSPADASPVDDSEALRRPSSSANDSRASSPDHKPRDAVAEQHVAASADEAAAEDEDHVEAELALVESQLAARQEALQKLTEKEKQIRTKLEVSHRTAQNLSQTVQRLETRLIEVQEEAVAVHMTPRLDGPASAQGAAQLEDLLGRWSLNNTLGATGAMQLARTPRDQIAAPEEACAVPKVHSPESASALERARAAMGFNQFS
eukprot:TRINITY_DN52247_c0_g1_i1.p1 TRINITY_DN52247_c0_g1~~TRINITY_DN52247_c0_g1_i1.p1  ORF type:complete len:298 (-),score=68.14 TRINITY_DN52247_c0_g1_i1:286-1179(-)